jgi:hypothetical protein
MLSSTGSTKTTTLTSGLDSPASEELVNFLVELARSKGMIIAMVIHQPNYKIYTSIQNQKVGTGWYVVEGGNIEFLTPENIQDYCDIAKRGQFGDCPIDGVLAWKTLYSIASKKKQSVVKNRVKNEATVVGSRQAAHALSRLFNVLRLLPPYSLIGYGLSYCGLRSFCVDLNAHKSSQWFFYTLPHAIIHGTWSFCVSLARSISQQTRQWRAISQDVLIIAVTAYFIGKVFGGDLYVGAPGKEAQAQCDPMAWRGELPISDGIIKIMTLLTLAITTLGAVTGLKVFW